MKKKKIGKGKANGRKVSKSINAYITAFRRIQYDLDRRNRILHTTINTVQYHIERGCGANLRSTGQHETRFKKKNMSGDSLQLRPVPYCCLSTM
jgi:hypothetical protein